MFPLHKITIENFSNANGQHQDFEVSYQIFGAALHTAPIVLVNHALTGNSTVAGEKGWWKSLIGEGQIIDLNQFTVIAFNIPGNGYQNTYLIEDYKALNTKIIAALFWKALEKIGVSQLFAIIGGSLGGGIAWEMAFLKPNNIDHLIPIATSLQSSDWLIGNVLVQEQILETSSSPVQQARKHAMLLYRTPASFDVKFGKQKKEKEYAVESWLNYHGHALEQRFCLQAYKTMNHLLRTIGEDINEEKLIAFAHKSNCDIHLVAVDSDYLFTYHEQKKTYEFLKKYKPNITFDEITSVHGHDAFLIEYEQLYKILKPIFQ